MTERESRTSYGNGRHSSLIFRHIFRTGLFKSNPLAIPVAGLILAMLPTLACGRYRARHELELNRYFAQILERVDRRWIGDDRFFEDNLLSNPYPEVRQWCAIALGRISSPRALPLLYQAIHTGDTAVRAAAAFAIGEIRDRELPGERYLSPDPQAISELRSLLSDPSVSVQMRAIEALGKAGSPAEATEIIRQLERPSRGNSSPVEQAYTGFAIIALARLKNPVAAPVLERMAKSVDPEIRSCASQALIRLESPQAAPVSINQPADLDSANSGTLASFSLLQKFRVSSGDVDPSPVESSVTDAVSLTLAASRKNSTIAIVQTTRGTLEIELFREDAPLTVSNFVLTAKRGNYNFQKSEDWMQRKSGFMFEQVIPSQQIGGDVTGTQTGFGWALNGEINMRPFERGSVGMSVDSENPNHRKLFIALSPQPFLDGIDTCFGRVISGMPVADRIVPGDKILHIDIKETISYLDYVRY